LQSCDYEQRRCPTRRAGYAISTMVAMMLHDSSIATHLRGFERATGRLWREAVIVTGQQKEAFARCHA